MLIVRENWYTVHCVVDGVSNQGLLEEFLKLIAKNSEEKYIHFFSTRGALFNEKMIGIVCSDLTVIV